MGITLKILYVIHIVRNTEYTDTEEIQVEPFFPANWFTERGASKKLHLLQSKGLPSFKNWRFLTLTVDPLLFRDNESAYNHIKSRMRYFIRSLKQALEIKELRYCWKLEFQENGNPHWHMILDYRKKIDIPMLEDLWGYGKINLQRINAKELPYTFKYITKQIDGLPSWFLSLSRPRVFQSSGLFPVVVKKKEASEESIDETDASFEKPKENLGQRLKRYSTSVLISKNTDKGFFPVSIVNLKQNFNQVFFNLHKALGEFLRFENPTKIFIPSTYINYITT